MNSLFSFRMIKATVLFAVLFFTVTAFSGAHTAPGIQWSVNEPFSIIPNPLIKSTDPLEKRGEAHASRQEWEKAAECYKQLLERYPDVADYHYKYGGFLGMMILENRLKAMGLVGDIKEAFIRASELDATHMGARRALVELYMQLPGIMGGSRKKALRYAEELHRLSPLEGYLAKGYIYEYDGKDEKAKTYYILALKEIDTAKKLSRKQLHCKIGQLCGDYKMKLDEGLQHLHQYIQKDTSYYETELHVAYCAIAKLHRLKNEKAKAMEWVKKSLSREPGYEEGLKEKARIEAL